MLEMELNLNILLLFFWVYINFAKHQIIHANGNSDISFRVDVGETLAVSWENLT